MHKLHRYKLTPDSTPTNNPSNQPSLLQSLCDNTVRPYLHSHAQPPLFQPPPKKVEKDKPRQIDLMLERLKQWVSRANEALRERVGVRRGKEMRGQKLGRGQGGWAQTSRWSGSNSGCGRALHHWK